MLLALDNPMTQMREMLAQNENETNKMISGNYINMKSKQSVKENKPKTLRNFPGRQQLSTNIS